MFAQGRADYYFSPLLLLVCGSSNFFEYQTKNNILTLLKSRYILKIIFSVQAFLFISSIFYMIALNMFAIFNYDEVMNKTAYGYYNSKIIKEKAIEPVLGLTSSPSRLFYNSEFIPNHNFWKCYKYSNNLDKDNQENNCFNKLRANTIIVEENYLKNDDNFVCESIIFRETPRNVFKSSKYNVDFCKRK